MMSQYKKEDKNQVKGSYTEYFAMTSSQKLKKRINIKDLLDEECNERHPF
jgi:hypothetical protein